MRTLGKTLVVGIVIFAIVQTIRPGIPARPASSEILAPPQVRQVLEKDCYSCHSDQRRLSWFDEVVPAYWLVRHDILAAREDLDFSTLGSKPGPIQKATLYEAVNMMQLGAMPSPQFVKLHPDAKATTEDIETLKTYLSPWATAPTRSQENSSGTGAATAREDRTQVAVDKVEPGLNGLPLDPAFANWKLISATDRGDNNTFRIILGNEIAVNAARLGKISPWPDGTRFAKIAWQQVAGSDGLLHPGKFVQVELMVKDSQLYKATEGWGWGRWRGQNFKPYGSNAQFVNECTGCHKPMRGNDYVYTLPIAAAIVPGNEVMNNKAAELSASLPYQPLGWNPITMYVDPKTHTTAVLFGNDPAIQAVRKYDSDKIGGESGPEYPQDAVLALVNWAQRDDPHWFGARIPSTPRSVEFVQVETAGQRTKYRCYSGEELTEGHPAEDQMAQRIGFIVSLKPVWLPKR